MTVRAKFRISNLSRQIASVPDSAGKWKEGEVVTVKASPVYGNGDPSHENTKFWQATPTGEITLGTVNASAAAYFELGAEYYVDFTRADK